MSALAICWPMGFEEKRIVVAVIGPARCGKSALIRALGNSDAKASHAKQVGDGRNILVSTM